MASAAANRPRNKKKPEWPKLRYGIGRCKRCRELDKLKLKPKPDDNDYIWQDDDFRGDEELMLRVIHYRRTCEVTGGFDVDCPPSSEYGCIYRREHYHPTDRTFDKKVERAVKFVVDTYNQQKGQNLILLSIQNVNVRSVSCWYSFYVTFEGFQESHPKWNDNSYVHIYQTVVSYERWRPVPIYKIDIFRKSNSIGRDEDLLPPDPSDKESTRVKKELMWTLN
ncbi:unnamed protein product [Linum tenue]|uniref:Uncharacterized protein n=1 Tax=Linum tenue TaxID=586396 RepID=A0AAV0IRU0_9ROSI|nr:unnamed protein product [Linum tenue]